MRRTTTQLTTTRPVPSDRAAHRERPRASGRSINGPLLVALEERHPIDGALHLAQVLARRDRVNAHLLAIVRPLAFPPALVTADDLEAIEQGRLQQARDGARQALHRAHGVATFWSTEAVLGGSASALARVASERGSALTIVGMALPHARERTACEDATLQIIRASRIPVLAVPPSTDRLPRRAIVAVDFSAASRRAAAAALTLLRSRGTLTLAHVQPNIDFAALGRPGADAIYASGRDALLQELETELRQQIGEARDITIDTRVLRGDASETLLAHAREGSYDLIAAGTAGLSAPDFHDMGSVSTSLLRGASCAVIVVPSTETSP
jgi:nucleotide-binding universal stress UspA family protein